MKNALLITALSMTAAGVTCGATLISEAATGRLASTDGTRATVLFIGAMGLTHAAVGPLALAGVIADKEAEA